MQSNVMHYQQVFDIQHKPKRLLPTISTPKQHVLHYEQQQQYNWDKGDPSNTTRYVTIRYYKVLLRQHVSTLSRGHHQAVDEVFIKS
jgi:hypothetical protein